MSYFMWMRRLRSILYFLIRYYLEHGHAQRGTQAEVDELSIFNKTIQSSTSGHGNAFAYPECSS